MRSPRVLAEAGAELHNQAAEPRHRERQGRHRRLQPRVVGWPEPWRVGMAALRVDQLLPGAVVRHLCRRSKRPRVVRDDSDRTRLFCSCESKEAWKKRLWMSPLPRCCPPAAPSSRPAPPASATAGAPMPDRCRGRSPGRRSHARRYPRSGRCRGPLLAARRRRLRRR